MNKFKAILAALLTALLVCGCAGTPEEPRSEPDEPSETPAEVSVNLAFCSNDRFNPFTALTSANRELCGLVFEPLIDVDYEDFEAVNVLASNVEVVDKTVTVSLKERVVFSDGTPLTAEDVAYSFSLAKKSKYIYSQELKAVSSCTVVDQRTVRFDLACYDPFADRLLTFPIIKTQSDNVKNSDSIELDPIGTGRYVREDKALIANEKFRDDGSTALRRIELVETPDTEAIERNVTAGRISVYFSDMSDEKVPQMIGKVKNVKLNNLVFIGINNNVERAVPEEIRQAVSMAADTRGSVRSWGLSPIWFSLKYIGRFSLPISW